MKKNHISAFASDVNGMVIAPGSVEYERARMVWNGMIDRRPALIVRCTTAADVMSSVKFAREHDLSLAVRGGGHNVTGNAVCDDGIVIDLSKMKGIRVDTERREAYAQAGLTWGEYDRTTQSFGLATPAGVISTTGIAGLTLGGGFGWLSRKHGLTCDNVLSADIVTADGKFTRVNPSDHGDLFWGLRGGGGNFGVVTSFQYRLHPVDTVMAGPVFHPLAAEREMLECFRLVTQRASDELSMVAMLMTAPPVPFLPPSSHGSKVMASVACHCGPPAEATSELGPLKACAKPLADLLGPMPYITLQSMSDQMSPPGVRHYWKSEYLTDLTSAAIESLVAAHANTPSPLSLIGVHHLQGAIARVGENETAFSHRNAAYIVIIDSAWTDPAEDEVHIRWAQTTWQSIRQFSAGGTYVNFLMDEGTERIQDAYGTEKYQRLLDLKRKYDRENLFRHNHNIDPR
jgi:FAD/FMN-containing dehydrogenase